MKVSSAGLQFFCSIDWLTKQWKIETSRLVVPQSKLYWIHSFVSVGHEVPGSWTISLWLIICLQQSKLTQEFVPGYQVFGFSSWKLKVLLYCGLAYLFYVICETISWAGGKRVSYENSILPTSHRSTQWKPFCNMLSYQKLKDFNA